MLHEACHALALRAIRAPILIFQIGVPVIYHRGIFALGLIPFFGGVKADLAGVSWKKQAFYYAGGPVGSIVIGIGTLLFGVWLNIYILKLLGAVSLALGGFNLIPVPPLDGYRLVTLGRQIPYKVHFWWTMIGWTLIGVGTLCGSR